MRDGMMHVSGAGFGYVVTRKEYADYYLRGVSAAPGQGAGQRYSLPRERSGHGTGDIILVGDVALARQLRPIAR